MSKKSGKEVVRASDKKQKWSKKSKIIAGSIIGVSALATAVVLVLVFVFDIGPVKPIPSTEEQARVVGTVAGFEVRYEELRYITLLHKAALDEKYGKYETLDESVKSEYSAVLKSRVLEDIKKNYAILSLCEKYGVDIDSKEAKNFVDDSISAFVDEIGGKKKYKEWLEQNNLTDAFLRLMYKVSYLETALVDKLVEGGKEIKYNDDNLEEFVNYVMEDDRYVKVIHAYYPKDWSYSNGRTAKGWAEQTAAALSAADSDEERFSVMSSAIGQAPFVAGYSVTGSDYYITVGQMHIDYENVAFSLEKYEASTVLELDEGYYVIMRVPKVKTEVGRRAGELLRNYQYATLKTLTNDQMSKLTFEGNQYFRTLKLSKIK